MDKTYMTSEVAKMIGVHPNTVRLYEKHLLIPKAIRLENGYRTFTDLHIDQFKLARKAFQIEILQNGLRKKIITAVKESALGHFDRALLLTNDYILSIEQEIKNAHEAAATANDLLHGKVTYTPLNLKRKEVSIELGISMDTLRNWEMNGLLTVKRKENGYRVYTSHDIQKLMIIRSLKCANYSLSAILRMMQAIDQDHPTDINMIHILNTPHKTEDIVSVCDKLITSLKRAKLNAEEMITMLLEMKRKYSNPPL